MGEIVTDEARDIAHDRAVYAFEGETNIALADGEHGRWGYVGFDHGFDAGYAAGVAEGIRQAREAVEGLPTTWLNPLVPAIGKVDALEAIDALVTT